MIIAFWPNNTFLWFRVQDIAFLKNQSLLWHFHSKLQHCHFSVLSHFSISIYCNHVFIHEDNALLSYSQTLSLFIFLSHSAGPIFLQTVLGLLSHLSFFLLKSRLYIRLTENIQYFSFQVCLIFLKMWSPFLSIFFKMALWCSLWPNTFPLGM